MLNFKKEYGSFLSLNHITSIVFALLTIDSKVKSKIVSTLEIELKGLSRNFCFCLVEECMLNILLDFQFQLVILDNKND